MTIEQILEIIERYKLRIPPTVYYDLLADIREAEEEQKPTTKNDLGVDAVSRQQAIERLKLNFPISDGADNSRDRHRYMQALADIQAIRELPSVTPQEPRKGHWIDINHHKYYDDGDIETAELRCSCCNEDVEWDIELLHKPYYCENCGADMREVEE